MKAKNSYIFLKRKEKRIKQDKDENVIVISTNPTFRQLLNESFDKIIFEEDKPLEFIGNGNILIDYNNKKIKVLFRYYKIGYNYYLDIEINEKITEKESIDVLTHVNSILVDKKSKFNKYYISINSFDYISKYYCNKIFPYLNTFERKLRHILFSIYTLNFNLEYFSATTDEDFQSKIKKGVNQIKEDNIANEDCYIKQAFYTLEYSEIDQLLFAKKITVDEMDKVKKFLNNKDLSKLSDKEIRDIIELCYFKKNDWERFFGNKNFDDNFQEILNKIRVLRNNVMHCKFLYKDDYEEALKLLKETIKSLDNAIDIIHNRDFINKNLEINKESIERFSKTMTKIVENIANPLIKNMEIIFNPLNNNIDKYLSQIKESFSSINFDPINIALSEIDAKRIQTINNVIKGTNKNTKE